MTYDPMPSQREDAEFLLKTHHGALWSEPGTGKTLSTLLALKEVGAGLVVAPAIALGMWRRELDAMRLNGVGVVSWGMLAKLALTHEPRGALVLDEAQYAVRGNALRTKAAYGTPDKPGMARKFSHVWPLTGTPMLRFADDLWPCTSALWMDHLKALNVHNLTQFERRYCVTDGLGRIVGSNQSSLKTLNKMLMGDLLMPRVVIRRTLKEVAPFLPPLTVRQLEIPLSRDANSRVHAALPANWMQRLAEAERGLTDDPAMATARRMLSLLKVEASLEMINDAPAKVIVIFVHTETGAALREGLKEPSLTIEGSTPTRARQGIVDRFNDPSGPRVLFGQLHTMGVAINPHEHCHHMIFVERDWSAAVIEQAINRVRRLGQTQHQQVDFLDTSHALDTAMRRTANRKLKAMGILMGDV
jgi:SWI/SNF-related matrix-associated actin-dependent regulator of chromatin subfamily A-like protein 1